MGIKETNLSAVSPCRQPAGEGDWACTGAATGPDGKGRQAQAVVDTDEVSLTTQAQADGKPIAETMPTQQSPEGVAQPPVWPALRPAEALPASMLLQLAEAAVLDDVTAAALLEFAALEAKSLGENGNDEAGQTKHDDPAVEATDCRPLSAKQAVALARHLRVQLGVERDSQNPLRAVERALAKLKARGSPVTEGSNAGAAGSVSGNGDQEQPS